MEGGGSIGNLYLQIQVIELNTYNIDLFLVECLMLIHLLSWMFYQDWEKQNLFVVIFQVCTGNAVSIAYYLNCDKHQKYSEEKLINFYTLIRV